MLASGESKLKSIRINYKNIRKLVMNEELSKVKFQDLKRYHRQTDQQIKRMEALGDFEHLEQVDFYKQKFNAHIQTVQEAFQKKLKWKQITPQVQEIYEPQKYVKSQSYLKKSDDRQANKSPKKQSQVLDNFFEQKRSKLVPEVGFKSLLQNPQVANTNFKKRIGQNSQELKRLRNQNEDLRRQIREKGSSLTQNDKQKYQQEIRRFQRRMDELESQNRRLIRQNDTLRSQNPQSHTGSSSYVKLSLQEQMYAPYYIQTQQNDLYKINVRNQSQAGYSNIDPFDQQDYMKDFKRDFDTYSEPIHKDDNQQYSIFDQTRSYFPGSNQIMDSSKLGLQNPRTVYRNKVAFFKQSGILVRDDDIEIGYKKSALDRKFSKQKVILYFNNKTRNDQRLEVFYDYQREYYDLTIKEKVSKIQGFRQTREVVEVQLQPNKNDLNSIIQIQVKMGQNNYKLWLPVMFIVFQRKNNIHDSFAASKKIRPFKTFKSPHEFNKILGALEITQNEGTVWGISRMHEGPINIKWKNDNKIQVKTSQKWIDYLSFIIFDYV